MFITFLRLTSKYFIIFLIYSFLLSGQNLYASKEPIIRVLIAKQKKLRVRADGNIPLVFKYTNFVNNHVKGITIEKEKNSTKLIFDKESRYISVA